MAKWIIDPDHSVATFTVRHMMVTDVHGQFNKISGTISFDPADPVHSSAEAEIDVSGIWTGISKRDEHLRSPDFFDVGKYPKITFTSTRAEGIEGRHFKLFGDLMIHGVTRQVVLHMEYAGPVKGTEEGEIIIGFTAAVGINREDYGMTWNVALVEKGGVVVGREVRIALDIEADPAE
ncbi:MAG: YceI family protein [Nitrospirae bacterium]|nr:YceI family protein [Nitrospirota bacterium]